VNADCASAIGQALQVRLSESAPEIRLDDRADAGVEQAAGDPVQQCDRGRALPSGAVAVRRDAERVVEGLFQVVLSE
jgi:hypothetical protein